MNKKIKWLLVLIWMMVIFCFSQQSGQESSETSGLVESILNYFTFIPSSIFGIELQVLIRKAAHFTEYFILYVLCFNLVKEYKPRAQSLYLALIIVFLYACSDEIHQAFIPGRACAFTDVLIDTAGGTLAMLILMIKGFIKQSQRVNKV
ncbi:MAG TPA: teicoplanin resistance protein VanZ [Firmicutes bacterium]|nr:teicoplanin resistance protein VanZ [Bacillota bacterium]